MKANPFSYGGIEIIAENDAEKVWLGQFLENIDFAFRPFLSNFIRVDMESGCVLDNDNHAQDIDIEAALDKEGKCWGLIDQIEIFSFGYYVKSEVEERIKNLSGQITDNQAKPQSISVETD